MVLVLIALKTGRKKYTIPSFQLLYQVWKSMVILFIRLYSVKSSFYRRVTGQILKNDQGLGNVFLHLFFKQWMVSSKEKKSRTKKNVIPLFIVLRLGMLLLRDKLESIELHSKSTKNCTLISRNFNESRAENSFSKSKS